MTDILEYLEYPQPTYNCIIATCKLTMTKLAIQVLPHMFHEAKKVGNILLNIRFQEHNDQNSTLLLTSFRSKPNQSLQS